MIDPTFIVVFVVGFFFLMIFAVLVFVYYSDKKDQEHELALARTGVMKTAEQKDGGMEKETIIKEVVMVPCQYCGGLMPQTATFCSNCGAGGKAQ